MARTWEISTAADVIELASELNRLRGVRSTWTDIIFEPGTGYIITYLKAS